MKAATLLAAALSFTFARAADPLPSWNDTAPKQAILAFKGWTVVSMKDDWATIYPAAP